MESYVALQSEVLLELSSQQVGYHYRGNIILDIGNTIMDVGNVIYR